MKNLKLHEIIKINESLTDSILIELLVPYKKSLLTYYNSVFYSEPILMVTAVMNAAQYAKIVPVDSLTESICAFLDDNNCIDLDSESYSEYENIMFNSIPLSKL